MVALDFPPCKSAGVQRTLKFAEYLSDFGWEPIILTVSESAHEAIDNSQIIPTKLKHIYRTFSFNASRDFSIKGKYLSIMKEPDRWWTWRFSAVKCGKKLIDELKPDVIWSTYPVSTAHSIAIQLAKYGNLPWVADYRDPVQSRYDSSAKQTLNLALKIEKNTIENASKVILTTKRAAILYQSLYPDLPLNKFEVIENGYDEANFKLDEVKSGLANKNNKFVMLHSGAVYRNGRDPEQIFQALSILKAKGDISENSFELVFRGIDGAPYVQRLKTLNISDIVSFKPSVSYMESLTEMMSADALLLIQGPLFRNQIPGKLFEYIRSGKPILALTSMIGATADLLENVEMSYCVEYADQTANSILDMLVAPTVKRKSIERFSRYEKTKELAVLLDIMESKARNVA